MTNTTDALPAPAGLVAEVLVLQSAPTCAERMAIRRDAAISVSRLAKEVGVTPQRIRQYERNERLPATANTFRYLGLLSQLDVELGKLRESQVVA